jgi:hypothetical protein
MWARVSCFAVVVLLAAGAARADTDVTVRWDTGLEAYGRDVERLLADTRRDVAGRLGFDVEGPAEVVLVVGHERMREVVRGDPPAWAVGVALGSRGLIVIRVDLLRRGFGGGLGPVLRHEWVHLAWGRRAGARSRDLPLWLEEGVAEVIGGGVSIEAGLALDRAIAFGNLLAFDAIAGRFPADEASAGLAYRQSRAWVAHFVERQGWPVLAAVLDDLATGAERGADALDRSLRRRTGSGLGEWHASWQQAAEATASPWYAVILQDVSWALLIAVALVGVFAFLGVRRRRRRQIEGLADEPPMTPDDED